MTLSRVPVINYDYREYRLAIPSNVEYSVPQLRMIIKEVEEIIDRKITANKWNQV